MVTLQKIGDSMNRLVLELSGLSTDNKPIEYMSGTPITNGSVFEEIDTGVIYKYNESNKKWIEQPKSSGSGGEISLDYTALTNKPQIAGKELSGNKTLDELGIQPKGTYLTEETDPTVPAWAKVATKPVYTADEVGALPKTTTSLKNPHKIIFSGAVTGEYDGSAEKTFNIPSVTLDKTLNVEGNAADSKAVGTAISSCLKSTDADKKYALKTELPKKGVAVADAGDADVKDKLNALLASLRTAGIIAQ